jgi:ATP adenylyltransferase
MPIPLKTNFCYNSAMDYLRSPWRMKYVQGHHKTPGCVFCNEMKRPDGPQNLIVYRGSGAFVILNRFPYTSGHLMVVPFSHLGTLDMLEPSTLSEMMELLTKSTMVLSEVYHPDGYNIGANIGKAAGAGIADHIHWHVVPRWIGDTNFMSTLGETRVLSELLEVTYRDVHLAWSAL